MRHLKTGNDLAALLNTLNALASVASRQSVKVEPSVGSAIRAGESWVERISKERWTGDKGIAIASAVVGVGAILYGARKLLGRDTPTLPKR